MQGSMQNGFRLHRLHVSRHLPQHPDFQGNRHQKADDVGDWLAHLHAEEAKIGGQRQHQYR